jgi:hypothetical protein
MPTPQAPRDDPRDGPIHVITAMPSMAYADGLRVRETPVNSLHAIPTMRPPPGSHLTRFMGSGRAWLRATGIIDHSHPYTGSVDTPADKVGFIPHGCKGCCDELWHGSCDQTPYACIRLM